MPISSSLDPLRAISSASYTPATTSTGAKPLPKTHGELTSEMVPRVVRIFLQRRFVNFQRTSEALLPTQQRAGGKDDRRQARAKASGLAGGLHGLFPLALFPQHDRANVEGARVSRMCEKNGCAELRRLSQLVL